MRILPRFIFYILSILFILGCREKKPGVSKTTNNPSVKGVNFETVKLEEFPETLELTGSVRPRTSAVVSTRIPGTVISLLVKEGDHVRKGQLLARLNAQETSANAASAAAGIDGAGSALKEAIARKQLADTTFERYQNLYKEQAVTKQEFDIKQSEQVLANQGVAQAEARLAQARQSSLTASTMAGFTKVSAPISGLVTAKQAALGATVFPAQPLFTIEEQNSYQLELMVPESLAGKVKVGTAAQISIDGRNDALTSTVSELVPIADPATRTFIAKVKLGLPGLKSGMFGRGTINAGNAVKNILVPKRAIVERGALNIVWVIDQNNIAHMRILKPGRTVGDRMEVLAGLSDGERIATDGLAKMVDGAKLQ